MAILAALILALIFPQAAAFLIILAIFLFLGVLGKWLLPPPGAPGAGDPTDIDPSLGKLAKGDVVVVKGNWVYDSLHPGWNEIHAVHDCQIIGHMDLPANLKNATIPQTPWLPGLGDLIDLEGILAMWCQGITEVGTIEAAGSRNDPQNQWGIHPVLDGCNPVVIVGAMRSGRKRKPLPSRKGSRIILGRWFRRACAGAQTVPPVQFPPAEGWLVPEFL